MSLGCFGLGQKIEYNLYSVMGTRIWSLPMYCPPSTLAGNYLLSTCTRFWNSNVFPAMWQQEGEGLWSGVEGTLLGALTRATQMGHSCLPGANVPGFCCCRVGRWATRISISLIPALWEIGVKIPSPACTQTSVPPFPGGDVNYRTNHQGRAGTSEWG